MTRPDKKTIICAAVLVLAFCVSLALRTAVPWEHVFPGAWIKCTDNDAYFYMRLLDNLSSHFPLLGGWDPYGIYPDGRDLSGQPLFFVYLMGFIAWLLGGGAPSQQVVDLVGVWFPAVLGALLVFPVFFIGRSVFNKWAGLAAAGFIALMPGEFLIRTLLGNADSHALEITLSTLFMLFLVLAVKAGAGIAALPGSPGELRAITRPAIYGAAAGIFLGLYILSWQGAVLFVLISFLWLVVQAVSDHLRGRPLIYLGVTGLAVYVPALLLSLAGPSNILAVAALGVSIFTAAALPALSLLMRRFKPKAIIYPAVLLALGIAGLLALSAAAPGFFKAALERLTFFFAWNPQVTIAEMRPLLIDRQGHFTLELLWGNYTSASLLAAVALAVVLYRAVRQGRPEVALLAVWSVVTLLSALAMQRFAYYLAINAAVLAGYTCWLILRLCGLREGAPETAPPAAAVKKARGRKAVARKKTGANPVLAALGIAAVALLVIYPNTGPLPGGEKPCFDVASQALYPPSDAWCESMDWLREETPQPFDKDGYYYAYYGGQAARARPSYSVLCWWDYGYWVLRMGQRVPVSHPGASTVGEQNYFMAAGGREAAQAGAGWNMRYVAVNDYLVDWNTGFGMVASAAGGKAAEYYDIYYRSQGGHLAPTLLYYPEYYRTMAVRLYCFDGKEYIPSETAVISWEEKTDADGQPYREISGLKAFRSYTDASAFLSAQQSGNWRMVGKDPLASPVPLEALEGYRPAFASSQKARVGGVDLPEVKIFELIQK